MRKRILIGVISAAIAVIVVGNLMVTRNAKAQDLPRPPEPAKTDDKASELLKKELDAKKPLPAPVEVHQPVPPVQSTPTIQPPISQVNDKPVAPIEKKEAGSFTFPPIEQLIPKKPEVVPPPVSTILPRNDDGSPITPPSVKPTLPLQSTDNIPPFPSPPKDVGVKPAGVPDTTPPAPVPPLQKLSAPPVSLNQPLAKPASSPWALHVEVVEGRTIITATINKKHEFKIVCDSLDLQTDKGTLKASGKVRINGDALQGHCNELSIPLNEDRLVLDGKAEVRIQRGTTTVSSETRSATFELKGESLNLRISDLQSSAHLIETHWRRTDDSAPRNHVIPASLTTDSKQWSSWGTLRHSSEKFEGQPVWRLENPAGSVIATLVTREGGTLTQYEGKSISVFGTHEQSNGRTVLRVSHIALP